MRLEHMLGGLNGLREHEIGHRLPGVRSRALKLALGRRVEAQVHAVALGGGFGQHEFILLYAILAHYSPHVKEPTASAFQDLTQAGRGDANSDTFFILPRWSLLVPDCPPR